MASFKDNTGQDWGVTVWLGAIQEHRKKIGWCLLDIVEDKAKRFQEIFLDPFALSKTLQVLCGDQISDRDLSKDDFNRLLVGDTLEHAAHAVVEAVIDFFPKARREVLRSQVTLLLAAMDRMTTFLREDAENFDLDVAFDPSAVIESLKSASSLEESAESTLARSVSES